MKQKIYFAVVAFSDEEQAKRFLEKANISGHVFREDKVKFGRKK